MNTPKISVIVPVYNVEQYLPRCIDSILAQTFTDFELLLIDDGSHDKSGKICDEYAEKDSRIRVFHRKNGGVSSARNLGLNNSKGEYILFIDSDDWVESYHIQNFINYDTDIVFQGYKEIDSNGNVRNIVKGKEFECLDCANIGAIIDKLLFDYRIFGYTWSKLFKRYFIEKYNIRFREDISIKEDELFTFEYCSHIQSIKVMNTSTYNYYYNLDSLSKRKYISPNEIINITNEIFNSHQKLHTNKETKLKFISYHLDSLIWAIDMAYYPKKIIERNKRRLILKEIFKYHKISPTARSKRILFKNILLTDIKLLIKYYIKTFIWSLRSPNNH